MIRHRLGRNNSIATPRPLLLATFTATAIIVGAWVVFCIVSVIWERFQ